MQSVLSSVVGLVDHIQFVEGRRCVFFYSLKFQLLASITVKGSLQVKSNYNSFFTPNLTSSAPKQQDVLCFFQTISNNNGTAREY